MFTFQTLGCFLLDQDGCIQVYARVVPQEAERCYAIFAPYEVLAIPPASPCASRTQANQA